jgi:hypothetical protein
MARFDPTAEAFSHPDPSQIRQLFIEDPAVPSYVKINARKPLFDNGLAQI